MSNPTDAGFPIGNYRPEVDVHYPDSFLPPVRRINDDRHQSEMIVVLKRAPINLTGCQRLIERIIH